MHLLSQIIYSCKMLYVTDGLSVHHQELKTVYTATIYVKQLLLPAAAGRSSCLTYTVAVYAVLSS